MSLTRIAAASLALTLVACGQTQQAADSAAVTGPGADVSPAPSMHWSQPTWDVAADDGFNGMDVAGSYVSVHDALSESVYETRTGRLAWQRTGVHAGTVMGQSVVYADSKSGVIRARIVDGTVEWTRDALCPIDPQVKWSGIRRIDAVGSDVYVECAPDVLIRLDASTGTLRARSSVFKDGARVSSIAELSNGAIAVTGWADGATLTQQLSLVRRSDLRHIIPQRSDTEALGAVGATAVLNDYCCFGRPDEYRPATILLVNLLDSTIADPIDLRPDPDYFTSPRPVGQDANAAVIGSSLYLSVAPMLYDYGDARHPALKPLRLADTLAETATFLANGRAALRLRARDGAIEDEFVDLQSHPMRVLWHEIETADDERIRSSSGPVIGYDAHAAPDVVRLSVWDSVAGVEFVRVVDGASVATQGSCPNFASDGRVVVVLCTSQMGSGIRRYLESFTFPVPAAGQ